MTAIICMLIWPHANCAADQPLMHRSLRDGLLLEDLDCFTADVAGRHISADNASHVTAALEAVSWLPGASGSGQLCVPDLT